LVLVLQTFILFGQQNPPNKYKTPNSIPPGKNTRKAVTMPAPAKGKTIRADTIKDLRFKIKHKNRFNKHEDPEVEKIKAIKNRMRLEGKDSASNLENPIPPASDNRSNTGKKTTAAPPLFLNHNFASTDDASWVPNDNSVAVSNSGIIVSTTNSNITIQNAHGFPHVSNSLNAFLGYTTGGVLYDAKVIYDDVLDRFFIVVLQGNTPSTSKLIVAFPTTTNPLGSWSSWYFNASSILSGVWLDYPSIGINDSSLYVSLNAYNSSDAFQYPVIYRLPKAGMLSGTTSWSWQYYTDPVDDFGNKGFTIAPLSYGQDGLYGHTMGFVSTVSGGANYVQFWTWNIATQTVSGLRLASSSYQIGSDALQLGSSNLLNVGDCRVKDAFVIYNPSTTNWNVYFTFTSTSSASMFANYAIKAKIIWNTSISIPAGSWSAYGSVSGDYCYPSIASYGIGGTDENVVMSANVSLSTTYPYFVAFSSDVSNNASPFLTIKSGGGFLNDYDGAKYRWGDYTHLARKFNSTPPIVWASGCYGRSDNKGGTWIGELSTANMTLNTNPATYASGLKLYPNPALSNFNLEFTTEKIGLCVVRIASIDGKYSEQLYSENISHGEHRISLSTQDLSSGNYIVSILLDNELIKSEQLAVAK